MGRKNTRHGKRGKRERGPSDEFHQHFNNNNNTTLEEDLRLQRLRQHERFVDQKQEREQTTRNFEDDEQDVIRVEIPSPSQASLLLPRHLMVKGDSLVWPPRYYTPNFSSLWMHAVREQSPGFSAQRRARLGRWAASTHLLENLQICARASTLYTQKTRWMDHTLPNDMHCSWDMTCKHQLHPSARTLDVMTSTNTAMYGDSIVGQQQRQLVNLPSVATILQGGWGLFQPPILGHCEPRIQTLRCKPVHAIRMHETSHRLGAVVRSSECSSTTTSSYQFHWYSLPHVANYVEADLPTQVHDFCFGNELAVFACARYGGPGRNSLLSPLFLPLDHPSSNISNSSSNTLLRSLNVQNFPQSDALRVEMSCTKQEKYLAFGHRNGQVSLLDLRQSQTCSAIISSGLAVDLGSVTDFSFLSSQSQLLVKRAFGPCQLHDLRKLTSSSADLDPSSLLRTLTLQNNEDKQDNHDSMSFHKMLSMNCNGFCVDPLTQQTTLVSPFINQLHQPCLGVWSLATGDLVGTKVLYKNAEREVYFVELCSKTTPAFHHQGPRASGGGGGACGVVEDPSSFGAWMKCGRFSKQKLNSRKVGSIHHLTFPGRWIINKE